MRGRATGSEQAIKRHVRLTGDMTTALNCYIPGRAAVALIKKRGGKTNGQSVRNVLLRGAPPRYLRCVLHRRFYKARRDLQPLRRLSRKEETTTPETYYSRVYTDRPPYADFDPPAKFQAIESIIAKRLREHPNAICSYSGGSDSDLLIDLVERVRKTFRLQPVKYAFFNTGLEMKATRDHVKAAAEKYGVEIETYRPDVNIVNATRRHGIPFVSKIMSGGLSEWQKKGVPLSIADEYNAAEDKAAKRRELKERYPKCESLINFLCCCNSAGEPRPNIQLVINSSKYMIDFIRECPPDFKISADCCTYCKKNLAHKIQKPFDMIITGERRDEGGMRSVPRQDNTSLCFTETSDGQYRLRPLYYVSDKDKAWYKEYYQLRYSDAYEVYGLTRTGCCGCSISYKAIEDLEKIRPYEPSLVKAAWNVFGKSYLYRQKYNEYKAARMAEEKKTDSLDNISIFDSEYETITVT